MGAMETAQLGARFPGTARALILEDAPWRIEDPKVNLTSLRSESNPFFQWVKDIQAQSLDEACARTRAEHPTWSELTVRYWTQGKQQLDLNNFTSQDYTWGNWQDEVRAIHVRTLLLTADPAKGGIITPDAARTVASLNPLFQVVPIPDAGHHVRFENYRAYIDAFNAFLQTID
jgi:pimeloyl-ACP methyl ester carboxylesterase